MNGNTIKLKVRREIAPCSKCGTQKEFYYLSDYSYGEKFILVNDGKDYAYVNLLENKVFDELEKIIDATLKKHNKVLSRSKFVQCLNSLFGITCDDINNKPIDTSKTRKICKVCGADKFGDNVQEDLIDLEFDVVTHISWEGLSDSRKRDLVEMELGRQGYLN